MSINKNKSQSSGFTLVEMLVIAPIALIVISGFIVLITAMVGDVIVNHSRNMMTHDTQNAISMIEEDVRLSTEFVSSSGTMVSPQGKDGNTSPFQSTDGELILGAIATTKNPIDPTRQIAYYDGGEFDCSISTEIYKNQIKFYQVVYYLNNDSLWRRTIIDNSDYGDLCPGNTPWQVNSCAPGYTSAQSRCETTDAEVLKNVSEFEIKYFEGADSPEEDDLTPPNISSASTISVSITSERTAAGRDITASSNTRVTKLNSRDINLAPPIAPTVAGASDDLSAEFTWSAVPDATSYMIEYNINGGSWQTATENTTNTSIVISSHDGDTVSVRVYARNTTGTSPPGASAVTLSL